MVYLPVKFRRGSIHFPQRYSPCNPDIRLISHYGVCIFSGSFLHYCCRSPLCPALRTASPRVPIHCLAHIFPACSLSSPHSRSARSCYDHAQLQVLSGYSGRIAALQLNSGRSHLLRSRSRSYTSVKYDPWSNPCTVLTTPRRLPCLDVSSPCTRYISYLVSFSPDLT